MDYHEAATRLFDLRRFAPRPGTAPTEALLAEVDDPQEAYAAVQVGGSNGKGSTARMLESVLRTAGYSVGLYTSPHLEDVTDRIRVDGRPMSEAALVEFVETVEPFLTERAAAGESPTFFETLTVMALWEFARQDVDVAVLEVGIGGTHDATSAVDPIAAGVTSVALEHTDVLGETIPEIARDKAGIAPADRPLVTAARGEALAAVRETAGEVVTVGTGADDPPPDLTVTSHGRDGLTWEATLDGLGWDCTASLSLLGRHQVRNAGVAAALARQVGDALGSDVSTTALERGLRRAQWPGRFEVVARDPLVVLDGAHNPRGVAAVAGTLSAFEYDDLHVVVGAMADKDHRGIAAALPAVDRVVACEPAHDRAESDDVIASAFAAETSATVETRSDVAGALELALEGAAPDDAVLVVGSLYAVAEARARWSRPIVPTRVDSLDRAESTLQRAHVTDAGTWRMRGKAVHRVLRTRVQPRQARYLKEELLSLGGECAISGFDAQAEERVDVVLAATLAQYKRLLAKLDDQVYGLAPFADELREILGIEVPTPESEYPWNRDRTAVMGILNVTPDSFHDGGQYEATTDAVARAEAMVEAGADIVDVGGESTRPGADPVAVETEIDRVVPVVERIADLGVAVSVDTRKPAVARAALDAGADILNDVTGLEDPEMASIAADRDAPVVAMHSIDAPVVPEKTVHYDDVVGDVIDELSERVLLAERAGLDRSQIIVDPGLGFGKSNAESFELLERLGEFRALGCPILVGHSHKSMFDRVDRGPDERGDPTVAATALAAERGADVVRVHDVAANRAAVDVVDAAASATDDGE